MTPVARWSIFLVFALAACGPNPAPDTLAAPAVAMPEPAADPPPEPQATPVVAEFRPPDPDAAFVRLRLVLPKAAALPTVTTWVERDLCVSTVQGSEVTVSVPAAGHDLTLFVPGHVVIIRPYEAAAGATTDLGEVALVEAFPLRGRILGLGAKPVHRAYVYPWVGEANVPLESTDDSGEFSFDGLPPGDALLRVEAEGYVTTRVHYEFARDAKPAVIQLSRGGLVRGRVIDPKGEQRGAGAYVEVSDPTDTERNECQATPYPDEDGRFDLRLPAGLWRFRIRVGRRLGEAEADVKEAGVFDVELRVSDE